MNTEILRSLSSIDKINSTLIEIQEKHESLTDIKINKLLKNLNESLDEVSNKLNRSKISIDHAIKENIGEILQSLTQSINHLDISHNTKTNTDVKSTISKIENVLHSISITSNTTSSKPVVISLLCDFDIEDHNGVLSNMMHNMLEDGLPFITSVSLLQDTGNPNFFDSQSYCENKKASILNHQDDYKIFEKDGVLVFIPINKDTDPNRILESLDLKNDGSLKAISVSEALSMASPKPTIATMSSLFNPESKVNKIFHLEGHGGSADADGKITGVGGLNDNTFLEFTNFLENNNCIGLAILSCGAGGATSLLNIPDRPASDNANFLVGERPHSFPTVVQSVGDFSVTASNKTPKSFLEAFESHLTGKEQTLYDLKKKVQSYEGRRRNDPRNFLKFYPAHSASIPGGFRPINELEENFPLTYSVVKKAELEQAQRTSGRMLKGRNEQAPSIETKTSSNINAEASIPIPPTQTQIHVHPIENQVTLDIQGIYPSLMSMTPGNGHHYIKKIALADTSSYGIAASPISGIAPLDFLKATIEQHEMLKLYSAVSKGFFISEISSRNNTFHNVILFLSGTSASCLWSENGHYYYSQDGLSAREISPLDHALATYELACRSEPTEKAVDSLSAGLESEHSFQTAIMDAHFFDPSVAGLFDLTIPIPQNTSILPYIVNDGNTPFLRILLERGLDPNSEIHWQEGTEEKSCSLFSFALTYQNPPNLAILDLLLEKKVDVEQTVSNDYNALFYAVAMGYGDVVKLLLDRGANPNISLDIGYEESALDRAKNNGNGYIAALLEAAIQK